MAPLRAHFGSVVLVLAITAAIAQDLSKDPAPTWPEDGHIPAAYRNRYVFLSRDRHTIVVLAPANPDSGMEGPKTVVRVPLRNDLRPSVIASVASSLSGKLTYRYSIGNGPAASDSIGAFKFIVAPEDASRSVAHFPTNGQEAWGGSAALGPPPTLAIAKHAIFTDAPQGKYVHWFQHGDNVIAPGSTLGGFVVESSYLPGLTTAWLSSGRLVEFDQSWPREIFQQLALLEDFRFREVSSLTVGPMFSPQEPKDRIAGIFQSQIRELVRAAALDERSPLVEEVATILANVRQNSKEQITMTARPRNPTESLIAMTLQLTLGIHLPEN